MALSKSKQLLADIAAKKAATKPAAKATAKPVLKVVAKTVAKPAAKSVAKPVAKPVAKSTPAPAPAAETGRLLYTFRLSPDMIAKLNARGAKDKVTHAEVARRAVAAYLAKAA